MKLLLFDIDGTLLMSTRGSGRKAMQAAFRRITGKQDVVIDKVNFSGRTDPQIITDVFAFNGFDVNKADEWIPEAIEAYVEAFKDAFSHDAFEALPGVQDLVKQLHDMSDVQLAILTGNVETTAYLKLESIGLAEYFPFGAFASDNADRYKLPRIAVDRALAHTGHQFDGKNVVIIGDTRHDILCGKDINVMSVAVSTGNYNTEDLTVHNPDLLFEDLSNVDKFMELVV